jgi:tetratricopeptide (TPR) repeat protein
MAPPGPVDAPFVGRIAERATLAAHADAARDGSGRVVLVSGEPGIGKTRLLEEVTADLPRDRTLWGRCHETEGAPPYWAWTQALRRYVTTAPAERLRAEVGDGGLELARVVPAVRARCPDIPTLVTTSTDPEAARFLLFDAVTTFLRAVAADELLVVALDDLHWADSESLLLLGFVAREIRDARLLVVGTFREIEARQTAAVSRILGDLARTSQRLRLGGLAVAEVTAYAEASGGMTVAPAVAQAIHEATDGNAYFVGELVALLQSEGQLGLPAWPARLELPEGVRDVIHRRVDPLPERTRRLLEMGSVLGRSFDLTVLAQMAEMDLSAVLDALGPAIDVGVLRGVPDALREARFAHALLQETLRGDLGASARAELHRRAGVALETLHAGALDPILGELAHHWFEAAPLGTLPRAIECATLAGHRAFAQLGYEEAAGHFERALQASRGGAVDAATRLQLLLVFGQAQQAAGDDEGARATLIEAAQLAHDLGDATLFASAVALAGASGSETGTVDVTVIGLLEDAIREAGPGDSRRRAFLSAQLSRSLYFADAERRLECSAEALAVARRLRDDLVLLTALQARHFALWEPGTVAERRVIGEEALALAESVGHPLGIAEEYAWRILDHLELGDIDTVEETMRRYRELAQRCRLPRVRWHQSLAETALALMAGRLEEGERLAHRTAQLRQPSVRNNVAPFYGVQLYLLYEEQGRLEGIRPTVDLAAAHATNLPIWRAGQALLYATLGETDAARKSIAPLASRGFADLPRDGNLLGTWARLAEVCALLGERRWAELLLPMIAPHADVAVVIATTAGILGSAARYAGLLARTAGRMDDAVVYFEKGLAMNARLGALPQLAHTKHDMAVALRMRAHEGDVERADALDAEAAETAQALGLTALVRQLEREDGESAAVPRAVVPSAVAAAARAATLRREGDVWTFACGEELTRVKDTKGIAYLAQLLRHPGREFSALDLGGAGELRTGDSGDVLDAEARRAYRSRLESLRDELAEAEEFNDVDRASMLREEMEVLAGELARASGLGGRARKAGSDAERARLNVTRALRAVIRKIASDCPVLGGHLDRSVQTGLFCAYEPDPGFPVEWRL